jgi:hypothetical protein
VAHLSETVRGQLEDMLSRPQMFCQSLHSYEDCFLTLGKFLDVATLKTDTDFFFRLYKDFLKENGFLGVTCAEAHIRMKGTHEKKWSLMTSIFRAVLSQYEEQSKQGFDNFSDPDYRLKNPL